VKEALGPHGPGRRSSSLILLAVVALACGACQSPNQAPSHAPLVALSPPASTPSATSESPAPRPKASHQNAKKQRKKQVTASRPSSCPSTPLRGVYHSYRLHVLGTCRWFIGTVTSIRHEDDGDYHVAVAPSTGYAKYLDSDNYSQQHGSLVTEVMPGQHLPLPFVGEHVAEFGTWVYDADHGWNEIHPIWAIRYGSGKLVQALPPATPQYDPDAGGGGSGGGGGGGGGGNCTPGYSPCLVYHGGADYDCAGGGGDGPYYTQPGVVYRVTGSDPYNLDGNGDGFGCE
jgi:hypothetical protein